MLRLARVDLGEYAYHAINRTIGRLKIFESKDDYAREYAVPNFLFHVVTAYRLVRKAGCINS